MNEFWMVWGENSRAPTVQHLSMMEAKHEAGRLARNNPGQRFFVLQTVGHAVSRDTVWVSAGQDAELPF